MNRGLVTFVSIQKYINKEAFNHCIISEYIFKSAGLYELNI